MERPLNQYEQQLIEIRAKALCLAIQAAPYTDAKTGPAIRTEAEQIEKWLLNAGQAPVQAK